MAKGQKRGNREVRKPKTAKPAAPAAAPLLGKGFMTGSKTSKP